MVVASPAGKTLSRLRGIFRSTVHAGLEAFLRWSVPGFLLPILAVPVREECLPRGYAPEKPPYHLPARLQSGDHSGWDRFPDVIRYKECLT